MAPVAQQRDQPGHDMAGAPAVQLQRRGVVAQQQEKRVPQRRVRRGLGGGDGVEQRGGKWLHRRKGVACFSYHPRRWQYLCAAVETIYARQLMRFP